MRSIHANKTPMHCHPRFVCMMLVPASAVLNDGESGGTLYFSCESDDDCRLTSVPIGEEIVSGSVQANPLMTESVALEFEMIPSQNELAVLPESIDELFIDLKFKAMLSASTHPRWK